MNRDKRRRMSPLARLILTGVVISLVVALLIAPIALFAYAYFSFPSDHKGSMTDPANAVAYAVWSRSEKKTAHNGEYSAQIAALKRGFTITHDWSVHDGFHGDGDDWAQIEMAEDFAKTLHTVLAGAVAKGALKSSATFYPDTPETPRWFPHNVPPNSDFYFSPELNFEVILPTQGSVAWFHWRQS